MPAETTIRNLLKRRSSTVAQRHRSDTRMSLQWRMVVLTLAITAVACQPLRALEFVRFEQDDARRAVYGRVLAEAQDGGLMLEGRDSRIWTIQPAEIKSRTQDDEPYQPLSRPQRIKQLLSELPAGFAVHETRHYLIFYNTSRPYAQWCGSLYERLYSAFFNFWKRRGLKLDQPKDLVALVFHDQRPYVKYAESELGSSANSVVGYYSLATNRMTTFDLTGTAGIRQPGDRSGSLSRIRRILQRPSAESTIATVIHEATHQLSFNCGLQRRFADNPLWLSEGLAIYFETPDLSSQRGWRKIGTLNDHRLSAFREYASNGRPPESLSTLLTDDQRFRDTQQAATAYAEAWALFYHLMKKHPKRMAAYLRVVQQKPYLGQDSVEQRIKDFEGAIGMSLSVLDQEFLRAASEWR